MGHKERIKQVLQEADSPMSTRAVAKKTGIDWHRVNNELHQLEERGEVHLEPINNRMKLWWDREIPY